MDGGRRITVTERVLVQNIYLFFKIHKIIQTSGGAESVEMFVNESPLSKRCTRTSHYAVLKNEK